MPVTLVPQNDTGDAVGANCYHDLAYFKAYHDSRGNSYSPFTDDQIKAGIIRATDYLDTRFDFKGVKLNGNPLIVQTTEWPRKSGDNGEIVLAWMDISTLFPIDLSEDTTLFTALVGPDGKDIIGIPTALKRASSEYGLRALTIKLFQDAPAPAGGRLIKESHVRVDVISQQVAYESPQSGAFALPAYPAADLLLVRAGLIAGGRKLMR